MNQDGKDVLANFLSMGFSACQDPACWEKHPRAMLAIVDFIVALMKEGGMQVDSSNAWMYSRLRHWRQLNRHGGVFAGVEIPPFPEFLEEDKL